MSIGLLLPCCTGILHASVDFSLRSYGVRYRRQVIASLVCDENAGSLPQIINLGIPSFSSCHTCLTPPHALRLACIEKFPRTREAIRLRPKGERLGHFIRNRLWTDRKKSRRYMPRYRNRRYTASTATASVSCEAGTVRK